MWKAHRFGHAGGILNVASSAAGTLFRERRAVVIQLQRDANDIIAFAGQLGRDDRTVDPAGHGDNNAGLRGGLAKPREFSG